MDNINADKIKNALAKVIYRHDPIQTSKSGYNYVASQVDLVLTPDLPSDPMASVEAHIKKILDTFDDEKNLQFISKLVKRSYSPNTENENYNKKHEKFIFEINRVLSYMKVSITEDGKIEEEPGKVIREKIYPAHEPYDFYKDLKNLIKDTKKELFVADAYVNEELLDLYVEKVPSTVKIRILTNKPKDNFITVASKFARKSGINFEVRKTSQCHDRVIFIDDNCYVLGQSIKDAATKKPTYIFKLENIKMKEVYEDMWDNASQISLV